MLIQILMEKKISVRSAAGDQPAANKRIYARPVVEVLSVNVSCSLLETSQTPWADAKPHKSDFGITDWDDETGGTGNAANDGANWAGYKKNTSIW